MSINKKMTVIFLVASFFVANLMGCDMFSSIKEYFNDKNQQKPQMATKQYSTTQSIKKQQTKRKQNTKKQPKVGPLPSGVLARIGDWSLTEQELEAKLKAEKEQNPNVKVDITDIKVKQALLDILVRQQLLFIDAMEKGMDKKKEIQSALKEVKKTLLVQQTVADIIKDVKVTDEEIQKTYDEVDSPYFYVPLEVKVSEIVVDSQIKATELLLEIQKGMAFSEVAKQNSIAKNASSGGDLGFLKEAPFPKMGDIILSLLKEKDNKISAPFKGPEGYYIVKIEDKKGGEKKPLGEVKDFIKQQLLASKQDTALLDYLTKIQQKVKVEINENLLKQEKK